MTSPPVHHEWPTVYVVVINWNGEDDTAACLESFLGQRGVVTEILVIDNASADGSGERLNVRYPSLHYLQAGENLGYAGGSNRGIEWAMTLGAEWVVVVNNDTVADPDCIRRMLDAAETDSRIGALAPLIVRFDRPDRIWFAGGRYDRLRAVGTHRKFGAALRDAVPNGSSAAGSWRECSFVTGCCLLLRRSALDEVGLFRADYFAYVEDLEFSLRLTEARWRIGWVPDARLKHRVPPEGSLPEPMHIRLRDRNRRRLVRERYPIYWQVLFFLWFWPTRAAHLVRFALFRDWPRASAIVTGMTER